MERYIVNPPHFQQAHGQQLMDKMSHGAVLIGQIMDVAITPVLINTFLRTKTALGRPVQMFLITEIEMSTMFLDIGFYILLPAAARINFDLRQDQIEWGRISYPQGDPYYRVSENIQFREVPIKNWFFKHLPEDYKTMAWKAYLVEEKCLSLLKNQIAGLPVEWYGMNFDDFIKNILPSAQAWAVFFLRNQEDIDSSYCLSAEDLPDLIRHTLTPGRFTEGFVAHSSHNI